MSRKVFANGMSVAAKAGDGKLIAAFPDACNSPPSPPTGPAPLPYPNSAFSRDLQAGAKSVRIGGKPAGVKDSYFKTSPLGNEAATKSFGGSLLSHTITGKAYFSAYSMDVMIEGQSVPRHLDLMTSNHGSYPGSTPPLTEMEEMALAALSDPNETLCPCCWSADCKAALSKEIAPGVERTPLSFREYYNLDEIDVGGALTAKATSRRAALASKPCAGGACPNAGKAVPKSDPPCDVYRVTTAEESRSISKKGLTDEQKYEMRAHFKIPLNKDILAQQVLRSAFAKAEDLVAAGWSDEQLSKGIQIDHTTPRAAGGCPSSLNNTAPHPKKCHNCKGVDADLDKWSGQELQARRAKLGI